MTTVEEITAAISELTPEQKVRTQAWLNDQLEEYWDAQSELDEGAGRLASLASQALAEYNNGRTQPL